MPRPAPYSLDDHLSKGARSALALAAVVSVALLSGVYVAQQGKAAEQTAFTSYAEAQPLQPAIAAPALATSLLSAEAAAPAKTLETVSGKLKRNDTMIDLLDRLGADRSDAYAALNTFYDGEHLDPRRLRPGLEVTATFDTENESRRLHSLALSAAPEKNLLATRTARGDFVGAALEARLTPMRRRVAATIETSIYETARELGAGDQQVVDFAKIFAYDVDFQREIHPGDKFEIVYEAWVDERGNPVKGGEALYAELDGKALKRAFYRHTPSDDGVTDYFDPNGESATKFLMKTPINGARLSSRFGKRRHPISGYTRMHKGTDFAAATGTPVYAAGHGTVERASRYGGYGHYVRIRHANGYKTAYAHLSRYGSGIKSGRRVRQGQVIGYVGSTGASTGPHLHYEVIVNGKHVNAMSLRLPTGRKLSGDMLDEFLTTKREIDAVRVAQGAEIEIAAVSAEVPAQ
ncbi:MAG: M23 family metallopeptidase [Pseudomonadota bacterium]